MFKMQTTRFMERIGPFASFNNFSKKPPLFKYPTPFAILLNQRSCTLELKELDILSICTWFLTFSSLKFWVNRVDFFPSLKWIFTACVDCNNPFQTRKKIQFIKLDISNWRMSKIKCKYIRREEGIVHNSD